jgi:hypothetical protein
MIFLIVQDFFQKIFSVRFYTVKRIKVFPVFKTMLVKMTVFS